MSADYGGYTREEMAEMLEWDWAVLPHGASLHHVRRFSRPACGGAVGVIGVTSCGYRGILAIPGLFERMGLDRCGRCSRVLGIKWPGRGSPKNDPAIRPWVEARLR